MRSTANYGKIDFQLNLLPIVYVWIVKNAFFFGNILVIFVFLGRTSGILFRLLSLSQVVVMCS